MFQHKNVSVLFDFAICICLLLHIYFWKIRRQFWSVRSFSHMRGTWTHHHGWCHELRFFFSSYITVLFLNYWQNTKKGEVLRWCFFFLFLPAWCTELATLIAQCTWKVRNCFVINVIVILLVSFDYSYNSAVQFVHGSYVEKLQKLQTYAYYPI